MQDKLEAIKERFEEVSQQIIQPEIVSDSTKYSKLSKEYKDLGKIVEQYTIYQKLQKDITNTKEMIATEKDEELRQMAKEELDDLLPKMEEMDQIIKELLIPKDPNDSRNIILEVRGGTGGDEAAIFAGDLFRMYQRFFVKMGWRASIKEQTAGTKKLSVRLRVMMYTGK
jgi:peptide chain release factor 1